MYAGSRGTQLAEIAIVHFTAPPAIGGVEALVAAQTRALHALGRKAVLVTASGWTPTAATTCVPLLDPSHPRVRDERARLAGTLPRPDHPLVQEIAAALSNALHGVNQCWVHNAFTMFLNPFLSVAVHGLARGMLSIRWVAWCEDLSAVSRHWPAMSQEDQARVTPAPGLEHVAISQIRRVQLTHVLGIPPDGIQVIRPPLDTFEWLGLGEETRQIAAEVRLAERDLVFLVPEKLLPHKNLHLVVALAEELRSRARSPLALISGAASPHDGAASVCCLERLQAQIRRAQLESHVYVLAVRRGRPPSGRTIRDLMLLSDLVFLPSSEEGYGMPLLEAAALRVPILCSDIPAFREAGGGAANFFSLQAPPAAIADQAETIHAGQSNRLRRATTQSWTTFQAEIEKLASGASTRNGDATPRGRATP